MSASFSSAVLILDALIANTALSLSWRSNISTFWPVTLLTSKHIQPSFSLHTLSSVVSTCLPLSQSLWVPTRAVNKNLSHARSAWRCTNSKLRLSSIEKHRITPAELFGIADMSSAYYIVNVHLICPFFPDSVQESSPLSFVSRFAKLCLPEFLTPTRYRSEANSIF